ncbi:MAG: hypothetical protein M1409_10285 [Actinobacteria bacterium]|nr:hypothetical protein [Actinomycetota bacterium]
MNNKRIILYIIFMGFLLTGCSPAYYKKSANKQVYGIINGSKLMKKSFTIVPPKPTIKFSNKKEKLLIRPRLMIE